MILPSTPTDIAALVFALPNDTAASIAANVRATGAPSVQLLIPDGTQALQSDADFARLRTALGDTTAALQVISADEEVLSAARRSGFDTVGVEGTHILAPGASTLDETRAPVTVPLLADDDREFLDALERVHASDRYNDDFDDLPEPTYVPQTARETPRSTRSLTADSADIWDDEIEDADPEPPRRTRTESRTESLRRAAPMTAARGRVLEWDEGEEDESRPRRRASAGRWLLPLLLIAVLIAAPLAYAFFTRATVIVALPPNTANDVQFSGEVIPLTQTSSTQQAAVQATQVSAPAEFTLDVQAGQTLTPVGVARGTVSLYSALGQAIALPTGTEFVGKNAQGQDVHFLIDSPATIPPAVTSSTIAGTSTTNGRVDVAVSARSPGSASNVADNTVTQMLIPGQPAINKGGSISFANTAIAGGDEQNVYVVTSENVQNALGEALTGLYKTGLEELSKQAVSSNVEIDQDTLSPNNEALGDPHNYDPPIVDPPIGQVLTAATQTFHLTVKATFSALAVPHGQPVSEQFKRVVPAYFQAQPSSRCNPGQRQVGFTVTGWRWDGARLTADGSVTCQTSQQEQQIRSQVLQAVRGQNRATADAALRQLQTNGVIASYTIDPANRQQFSRFDPLLNVLVSGAASALPTQLAVPGQPTPAATAATVPTTGAP